jgi:NTE family protein
MKAALVISGGGAKGAFAGGVASYLLERNIDYSVYVGSSTGSLLAPLLALGKIDVLRNVYTNVGQNDIFSRNPFIIKKDKDGQYSVKINHMMVLGMFLRGKVTFGESENLKKLVKSNYSETDHQILQASGKTVIVTVSNFTTSEVEYKYIEQLSYDDAIDWIWASANVTPFMSLLCKDGFEYGDGGFGNVAPIQKAIDEGCCHIDAIILENQEKKYHQASSTNGFDLLAKVLAFSTSKIMKNDITIGNLESWHKSVHLNMYFPPRVLTYNSLIFDSELMNQWWHEGYDYAKSTNPEVHIIQFQ